MSPIFWKISPRRQGPRPYSHSADPAHWDPPAVPPSGGPGKLDTCGIFKGDPKAKNVDSHIYIYIYVYHIYIYIHGDIHAHESMG